MTAGDAITGDSLGDASISGGCLVGDVELAEPLPTVSGIDSAGRRVDRVWLLVRLDTVPVGVVCSTVPEKGLTPAELATLIDRRLPSVSTTRLTQAGLSQAGPSQAGWAGGIARSTALLRRPQVLAGGPELTVVVCTRDRPVSLARCLDSLLQQEYRRFTVLVVASAPRDGATGRVVASVADRDRIRLITVPEPGLSRARNAALAATPGETVAFIDDDEIADRHWLTGIAWTLMDRPDVDVVCGAIIPAELGTPAQRWFEEFGGLRKGRGFQPMLFRDPRQPGPRQPDPCQPGPWLVSSQNPLYPLPPFGYGANLTLRPRATQMIGRFDTALGAGTPAMAGEDTLALCQVLLAGGTIAYQPAALTRHTHRRDLAGLTEQLVGYGTGLTASYLSLIVNRPSVLPRLLALAPTAVREVFGRGELRTATLGEDFPREVLRANRVGMLRGPYAYLRGRIADRGRLADQGQPGNQSRGSWDG